MKRFLGIIIAIIFLASCEESRPEGVFDEKQMADILFDLHLADGFNATYYSATMDDPGIDYYASVYEKYKTDSAGVRANLTYYAALPQTLQDIYAEVSKRLQHVDGEYKKMQMEKEREIAIADSIASKRRTDSVHLKMRDSLIHFNGPHDLFLPDTLKKDTLKKNASKIDSLKHQGKLIPSLSKAVLNEQKHWEMMFYYFKESKFLPLFVTPSDSTKVVADEKNVKPKTDLPKLNE